MAERFTKTDVERSFGALRAEMAVRGKVIVLYASSPGDGVTRYWITRANGSNIFPYAFRGAREAYIGITNALRLFEYLED